MYIITASISLSAAWILWHWAYSAHRRAVPAKWTRAAGASTATVLVWVFLSALGVSALVAAAFTPIDALRDLNVGSAAASVIAPVLAILLTPTLRKELHSGSAAPISARSAAH